MPSPPPVPNHDLPRNGTPSPERPGIDTLIAEAEALRSLLHDAAARAHRLLGVLKQQRRQGRALKSAIASLRDLDLHP